MQNENNLKIYIEMLTMKLVRITFLQNDFLTDAPIFYFKFLLPQFN